MEMPMSLKPNTQTGTLNGKDHGTNDALTWSSGILAGDALQMTEESKGGNDELTGLGGASITNALRGDAQFMYGDSRGGIDVLRGGDGATNRMGADASEMHDNARGGNDVVIGGDNA